MTMNDKQLQYKEVRTRIDALIGEEDTLDWVAIMATVACELHHAFDYYHWTGFYRVVAEDLLLVCISRRSEDHCPFITDIHLMLKSNQKTSQYISWRYKWFFLSIKTTNTF